MKTLVTILFLFPIISFAQQPTYLNTGDFTGSVLNTPEAMSSSLGSSYIITKNSSGTGTRYFRFASGTSGWTNFGPAVDPTATTFGTKLSISTTGTENNCTLNAENTTDNFIFKTNDSKELVVFSIQGDVQTIASTSRNPSGVVFQNTDVKITANLSGSLPTGQGVYLRFSSNNWSTSTVRGMTGLGTSYSTYIYQSENTSLGATVKYYLFTSGSGLLSLTGSDADLYTINYLNNDGSNYSYTISATAPKKTSASGDWNNTSTWNGGVVPNSSDHVVMNHNVTLNTSASIASLTINDGVTLTSESGQARNLTIGSGGDFNNNGTFTSNDGKVSFSGMNTVCGTVSFYDVDIINNYLDFGTTSTITGTFSINPGSVSNYPTYADNSTLIYKTNGSRTPSTEWRTTASTGRGVPYNVQVTGGASNTSLEFSGGATWSLRGSFTIDASQTVFLSDDDGGDIFIKGNFVNNGTLNAAGSYNRQITLEGSSAQTIRTNGAIIEYLKIDNSGSGISLDDNLTISKRLTMNQGNINCNGSVLFISNGTADDNTNNGIVRNAGIIYNTTPYKIKRAISLGNNGNYLFPIGTSTVYSPGNLQFTTPLTVNRNILADMTYNEGGTNITEINDDGFAINTRSNSYWRFDMVESGTDGALILSLTNPNQTGIGSAENLRIMAAGSPFYFPGVHTNGTGTTAKRNINISSYGIDGTYYMGGNTTTNPLPVELTSFTAQAIGEKILLHWQTATEKNNYGFEVERSLPQPLPKERDLEAGRWERIGFVPGNGNSNSPKLYEFKDDHLVGGNLFIYRLKMIDTDGSYEYSNEIEVKAAPSKFSLLQNYPNPFNPITKIKFSIPQSAFVRLQVYDIMGKLVTTLVNAQKEAGYYEINFNASQISSGVYFYRLTTNEYSEIKKMIFTK